ncbi:MAG TPA: Asp-tRNA(Asn)/Glu-tRNA(Gln) amidotransferase subunit GatB [Fimbriimonadaceae bacterium]|nr:Asp-tRNA(Asn)/Glu-tRNA(Gln) amidotransferase subunit GatB [Fimbriimonadaceae bacterium]
MPKYVASVGMEVHAELSTRSKMFCRCPVGFGGEPNTRVCPVCLGMPGTLPVPNRAAVEMVLRTALALNCEISLHSNFQRKNYFYPDLPKGYQISQYTDPLGHSGWLEIPAKDGGVKKIHIRRIHLEEDTGKLMHLPSGQSGVDYNRAGWPLMEIVTEFPPDIEDADEAKEYIAQLRQILMYLGVCDGKMEEGSLRCEPNVSVRPEGREELGTKTELKNLGSFRSVQLGVNYEVARQIAVLEAGGEIHQETRGWNEQKEESFLMRRKETENDYRYFPDPDLVPMAFDEAEIERLRQTIPELPLAKSRRYREQLGLNEYDAGVLTADQRWAAYFEEAVEKGGEAKSICNLMMSDFAKLLNETGQSPDESKVSPATLVELSQLVKAGTISGKIAKDVLPEMFLTGKSAGAIVKEKGATQISDRGTIVAAVRQVLAEHPEPVAKYKAGQTNVKGFLVGQVMRATSGRGNPGLVQEIVQEELER